MEALFPARISSFCGTLSVTVEKAIVTLINVCFIRVFFLLLEEDLNACHYSVVRAAGALAI